MSTSEMIQETNVPTTITRQDLYKKILNERNYLKAKLHEFRITERLARKIKVEELPGDSYLSMSSSSISISIPWGVDNLRQARRCVGDGWENMSQSTCYDGSIEYAWDRRVSINVQDEWGSKYVWIRLSIRMSAGKLDNTCQKVLVEEKTYTSQVYKVICNGVEQEDSFRQVVEVK